MNLKENLFAGQTVRVEISLDYLFDKTLALLNPELPKKEETANFIVGNFEKQGNLGQLFVLVHNITPSVPKFQVGDTVTGTESDVLPYYYSNGNYIRPETCVVTKVDVIDGKLRLEGTVQISDGDATKEKKVSGWAYPEKLALVDVE